MEVNELITVLEAGEDLMSVVGSLGLDCLNQKQAVKLDRWAAGESDTITTLRTMVAAESRKMWASDGGFVAAPSQALKDQLAKPGATPSLATITVLEGICFGAAKVFFANASSLVSLKRGSVVPLPERWLPEIADTPKATTTHSDPNLLDEQCNFMLWDLDWGLELDYTYRDRLDDVCAVRRPELDKKDKKRLAYALPKIATVHPFGRDDMDEPDEKTKGRFFGVHPKPSIGAHQKALDTLAKARDHAQIAMLPEFCLHSPNGLDKFLAGRDPALPELVVAGSAHTETAPRKNRANTSHVFLDQQRIMSVSKYQPFVARLPDGNYTEDIVPLPPVLRLAAGTATRLAVAICSDLNSADLLGVLTAAGVNLLLCPSWTPEIGVATAALSALAGYCQCIGVVANTPGHLMAKPGAQPFWACSGLPRQEDAVHTHYNPKSPPAVGVLDPNLLPSNTGYWTWLA